MGEVLLGHGPLVQVVQPGRTVVDAVAGIGGDESDGNGKGDQGSGKSPLPPGPAPHEQSEEDHTGRTQRQGAGDFRVEKQLISARHLPCFP